VLGLFRVEGGPETACGQALAAALESRHRLGASRLVLDFGIALHLGEVIYGNVGVPERACSSRWLDRRSTRLSASKT
jgi:hypothetical protein